MRKYAKFKFLKVGPLCVCGIWLLVMIGAVMFHAEAARGTAVNSSRGSDWIYRNMELLAREGLTRDYPSDWVQAGHKLSRSEIAYYLKQILLQLGNKSGNLQLSPQIIGAFQDLVLEFQKELADLGIKATDINEINLNPSCLSNKSDRYQDLDLILEPYNNNENASQSYYYYGQYYNELQRKSFFFIPSSFITTYDAGQLEINSGAVNILYQPQHSSSFLVLKGNLPAENRSLEGYYLFPITDIKATGDLYNEAGTIKQESNRSILSLLDEVNQIQQVDRVFKYYGALNLDGFLKLNVDLLDLNSATGSLDEGLKIGGLLIYSNNSFVKNANETKDFGLPVFNTRQTTSLITPVDLDLISSKSLQSLQINIQGTVEIAPQTALFGGIDFFYQGAAISLDNLWPSDTKASAGVTFHVNDYWTFLTYQSLVNSQNRNGWFSTTSVGVEYNNWITLWLAYQFLEFDNPTLTGTLSLRF